MARPRLVPRPKTGIERLCAGPILAAMHSIAASRFEAA